MTWKTKKKATKKIEIFKTTSERCISLPLVFISDVLTGMRKEADIHKLLNDILTPPKICPFWVPLEVDTQTRLDNDWTLNK